MQIHSFGVKLVILLASSLCLAPCLAQPPVRSPTANPPVSGPLVQGRYDCWAAAGVAGTMKLEIRGDSSYAGNGKAGSYTYDAQTRKISFQTGPWAGFYGGRLGNGKIGISSRPGGSYNTTCDLK